MESQFDMYYFVVRFKVTFMIFDCTNKIPSFIIQVKTILSYLKTFTYYFNRTDKYRLPIN